MPITRPTDQRLRHANGSAQHVVIDGSDAAGRKLSVVTLRITDSPLERLLHRKPPAITGDQFHASQRFYADWYHAHPHSSGTVDFARTIVDNGAAQLLESERMMAARTRFEKAIAALCRRHAQILQSVVIEEESLESFGRRIYSYRGRKDARTVALAVLRDALDALVDHYDGKRTGGGIRSAHEAGYRPAGLIDAEAP